MRCGTAIALALFLVAEAAAQEETDLVYVKSRSRRRTHARSIEATLKVLGPAKQSPWKILGPFLHADGRGLDTEFIPEDKPADLDAKYDGLGGRKISWEEAPDLLDATEIRLEKRYEFAGRGVCYAYRTIEVDSPRAVTMVTSWDDAGAVFVNGKGVFRRDQWRPFHVREPVTVRLRKGVNTLLFKVVNFEGMWAFHYQLAPLSHDVLAHLDRRLNEDFPDSTIGAFYRVEDVSVPKGVALEAGGLAFLADGTLMICTRRGEIWSLREGKWGCFAYGLHEPLGIWPGDRPGELYVVQRPELTRIRDGDGDGRADLFETFADNWEVSGNYHEFAYGPVRDRRGNFWLVLNLSNPPRGDRVVGEMDAMAAYRGWCFRVSPDGTSVPWASGFRSPNGMGMSPEDELFIAENQGGWVGTNMIFHVTKGSFYGHPGGLRWEKSFEGDVSKTPVEEFDRLRKKPAILMPYGAMGQSTSEPRWDDTEGKFGPFAGQMFVGDQRRCVINRVTMQKVKGEYQGATFPFLSGFQCGVNRIAWAPDGSLYVGETDRGWKSTGRREYGLERVVWTGRLPMEILDMKLTPDGFDLTFTRPVQREIASDPRIYSFQTYHYLYHPQYGSPEIDRMPVRVKGVQVSPDGRKVSLQLGKLVEGKIYDLHIRELISDEGHDLLNPEAYYTLNHRLD